MAKVRNMAELEKVMGGLLEEYLKYMAIRIEDVIKDFVQTEFYDQYEPVHYERMEWILRKCTSTKVKRQGNTYNVIVYIDPEGVNYESDSPSEVWGNMANGWHGNIIQTEGRFWDATLESIGKGGSNDFFETFKMYLISKGIDVVRK